MVHGCSAFARIAGSLPLAPTRPGSLLAEPFPLVLLAKGLDDGGEVAGDDGVELVQGQVDAVVGDSVLREVVGADALAAVAGADLALARLGALAVELLLLPLVQSAA